MLFVNSGIDNLKNSWIP